MSNTHTVSYPSSSFLLSFRIMCWEIYPHYSVAIPKVFSADVVCLRGTDRCQHHCTEWLVVLTWRGSGQSLGGPQFSASERMEDNYTAWLSLADSESKLKEASGSREALKTVFGASPGSPKPEAERHGFGRFTCSLKFIFNSCFACLFVGQCWAAVPRGLLGNQQEPQVQKT